MEKKERITVYLPQKLYIEIFDRHLEHQFSYLVALLVEEFIRATDARIIWAEMPSKAEQREYLERKLREFLSRNGLSTKAVQPPVQEPPRPTELPSQPPKPSVQEVPHLTSLPPEPPKTAEQSPPPPKEGYTPPKPEPVKESPPTSSDYEGLNQELLRKLESFW